MSDAQGSKVYTAWIVLVLAVLLPPLWVALRLVPEGRRARAMVRRCARAVVACTRCRVTLRGQEHVAALEHGMFVSNHSSMADAAFLLAALPVDVQFIANHTSARYPILGLAVRRASYFIVDRGSWRGRAECAKAMVTALKGGHSLLVFPEGTTAEAGGMLPFRSGAFRAAAQSGSMIVPIAITGTRTMFPASGWLSRARIDIEILPPLLTKGATREAVAEARDAAAAAVAKRLTGGEARVFLG